MSMSRKLIVELFRGTELFKGKGHTGRAGAQPGRLSALWLLPERGSFAIIFMKLHADFTRTG